MKYSGHAFLTALFCLFINSSGFTQSAPSDIIFKKLGLEDGIQSTHINAIVQDSMGFIWYSGARGPVRYDGHSYRLYEIGSERIADVSQITNVVIDANGLPWFGHDGAPLISSYSYRKDSVFT